MTPDATSPNDATLTEQGLAATGQGQVLLLACGAWHMRYWPSKPPMAGTTSTCNACQRYCTTTPTELRP